MVAARQPSWPWVLRAEDKNDQQERATLVRKPPAIMSSQLRTGTGSHQPAANMATPASTKGMVFA